MVWRIGTRVWKKWRMACKSLATPDLCCASYTI